MFGTALRPASVTLPVSQRAQLVVVAASRRNAKREKVQRNKEAARRLSKGKNTNKGGFNRGRPGADVEAVKSNWISPFKYTAEESAAAAAKIVPDQKK